MTVKNLILLLFIFVVSLAKAQTPDTIRVNQPYCNAFVETQTIPKYNGDVMKLIADSLHYSDGGTIDKEIDGIVYVGFTVEANGTISNVRILKGIAYAPDLNKEAVRVVSLLKSWQPGTQNGHAIAVQMTIPIRFSLKIE